MGELAESVRRARDSMFSAIQDVIDTAGVIDNANITAQQIKNLGATQENLVALRTSLSECIAERDAARRGNDALNSALIECARQREREAQRRNGAQEQAFMDLQEFNDKQRQQLESLQKEMAAIHMFISATSRTKLDDAASEFYERGIEMPFLLKTVYDLMDEYFSVKYEAERRASRIRAARHELES